jgi:hypothetical protein
MNWKKLLKTAYPAAIVVALNVLTIVRKRLAFSTSTTFSHDVCRINIMMTASLTW